MIRVTSGIKVTNNAVADPDLELRGGAPPPAPPVDPPLQCMQKKHKILLARMYFLKTKMYKESN